MATPAEYAALTLHNEIVRAAEARAKKTNQKAWKALSEVAPLYPVYDIERVPAEVFAAWKVAVRVATDDIVHGLLKLAVRFDEVNAAVNAYVEADKAAKAETASKSKSVADV